MEVRFEEQRLASFSGLLIFQRLFAKLGSKAGGGDYFCFVFSSLDVEQAPRIGPNALQITLLLNLTGGEVKRRREIAPKSLVEQRLRAT